jgi:hypothetical protein
MSWQIKRNIMQLIYWSRILSRNTHDNLNNIFGFKVLFIVKLVENVHGYTFVSTQQTKSSFEQVNAILQVKIKFES